MLKRMALLHASRGVPMMLWQYGHQLQSIIYLHVLCSFSSHNSLTYHNYYRWVLLKPDFLGAWKSVRLKHYPAYPITIISLIIQRNLATKIWAKQESSLTAVQLKRDPPVYILLSISLLWLYYWLKIALWEAAVFFKRTEVRAKKSSGKFNCLLIFKSKLPRKIDIENHHKAN